MGESSGMPRIQHFLAILKKLILVKQNKNVFAPELIFQAKIISAVDMQRLLKFQLLAEKYVLPAIKNELIGSLKRLPTAWKAQLSAKELIVSDNLL